MKYQECGHNRNLELHFKVFHVSCKFFEPYKEALFSTAAAGEGIVPSITSSSPLTPLFARLKIYQLYPLQRGVLGVTLNCIQH